MHPVKSILATAFLLLCSITAIALPGDRLQPIKIESNRAEHNDKLGTMVYQGNVVIRQGSILIRASKVTVYSTASKANRVVCIGSPAHYQQKPDGDKGLILASANTIEYMLDSDQIHLIDNASLEQDGTTITGERIDYDIAREVVKAKGDNAGKQRIIMVIPPSSQSSAEDQPRKGSKPGTDSTTSGARPAPTPEGNQ